MSNRRQGIYWIITLSCEICPTAPRLLPEICWVKGQQERGDGGFLHWQFVVGFHQKASLRAVSRLFPGCHAELTRSSAAETYVWKEDTRVPESQFELGTRPFKRSDSKDWEKIWDAATKGDLLAIPADVRVRCYGTLRRIAGDFAQPSAIEKVVNVFWGLTGTGKSRRAWDEAGMDAYTKDPRTKFWCGYQGQRHVVFDEFRGAIDVAHLLRWLDRYPVIVETKGGSICLQAISFWFTSNIHPNDWYPELDQPTKDALIRRLNITHFHYLYFFIVDSN